MGKALAASEDVFFDAGVWDSLSSLEKLLTEFVSEDLPL